MTSAQTTNDILAYQDRLRGEIGRVYEHANKARARMLDPSNEVEAKPAGNLAERVEGLVGPKGIAKSIVEYRKKTSNIVPLILNDMLDGRKYATAKEREAAADQAVRTSLAILTEGVVAAPIEGISDVKIQKNPDGSEYLSIFFSGPIRSAGGTAQGQAVMVGDYIRRKMGLSEFRPTKDEIERYVEEVKAYDERVSRLQYKPSDDEVRAIVEKLAVCVDGDPTEDMEVAIHRDLERIPTNRIRGGMCLVIAEGMAQKKMKLSKYAEKLDIDWSWLAEIKKSEVKVESDKPRAKFMSEVVGGRPIFSAPSAKGGFRIRYGHTRCNGLAAKSMHPATLIMLDDFIATGTQVKVEKPGKGCVVTECDTIDGPIVKLKDGSVEKVQTRERARKIKDEVKEIIFLGDILVTYGDFLQTNTKLSPSGYVEEWWIQEAGDVNANPTPSEAVEQAKTNNIPLHPRYTYYFADVPAEKIKKLAEWLGNGAIMGGALRVAGDSPEAKRVLELVGVPHKVETGEVVIDEYAPLLAQLGMEELNKDRYSKIAREEKDDGNGFDFVSKLSTVKTKNKSGEYIGCRMGRPEKARERKMQPAVHALFPIGNAGGRERSVNYAAEKNRVEVEVSQFICPKCRKRSIMPYCADCNTESMELRVCSGCGYTGGEKTCPNCRKDTRGYQKTNIDVRKAWADAVNKIGKSTEVKGVMGMISQSKVPEPLEKGLLRALNEVYVFKDGTIRFDATDVPLTQFRPDEVGVPASRLKELGYETDHLGNPLTSEHQILQLKPQDIVISEYAGTYLVRVAAFVDQLLSKFYGMEPFYRIKNPQELIGQLVVGLAPHTSAGVIGRVIGYTKANVIFAHPFWHAAKRRNADGDEDSIMLLADTLLNFSLSYLPKNRGGKMDAPLVITTIMNPLEVDDEAHKMEVGYRFDKSFYEKAMEGVNPSEANVTVVRDIMAENPYSIGFTHDTGDITGPVFESKYVTLDTMKEKIDAQLAVAEKIRAIDEREVAKIVIDSHFLRDTYGNLRAFSRQRFRCVKCNENYRRVPLVGKCTKCGGKLLLTVSQGNITKYLGMSMQLAEKYGLSDYLKSRLKLLKRNVESLTVNDLEKQVSLADFM